MTPGGTRPVDSRPFDARPFEIGRLPRIVFGSGRLAELPGVVRGIGSNALVIGRSSFIASPRWQELARDLADAGVEARVEIPPPGEPSPGLVDEIVGRWHERSIDVVVGIGGGSVLDTAKAVAGMLISGRSVTDHLEGVGPQMAYAGPSVPFVAVPTTAGTGAEATKNAVLSVRGPDGYKRSFRDDRLVAAVALVDPELLSSCPPEVIAADGMDALTQLLESTVSTRSGPFTDALARSGVAAAARSLLEWHAAAIAGRGGDPGLAPAREGMAYAALASGVCLAHAGLGAVHGLASPLGALFPIPHGIACGATLAAVTRANITALAARAPDSLALATYDELGLLLAAGGAAGDADRGGGPPAGAPTGPGRDLLVALLAEWRDRLGVPGLAAFGVAEGDIPRIVAGSRGSSMRTNPIVLEDAELAEVLRASL